jgi:hypothetical protein
LDFAGGALKPKTLTTEDTEFTQGEPFNAEFPENIETSDHNLEEDTEDTREELCLKISKCWQACLAPVIRSQRYQTNPNAR